MIFISYIDALKKQQMRKLIPFLLTVCPFVMKAQNSKTQNDLINDQFDKLILNDQKRKVEKTTAIPPKAVIFQCSDSIPAYTSKMELGDGVLKNILENPKYSEASKIQFIKDALSDTEREGVSCFNYEPCNFWRSSKEATALVNVYFDSKQFENSKEEHIRYQRLMFITQSQYPESYQMIVDYFKNRPNLSVKYHNEADLVYWLVQMGKDEDALNYLELLVEDLIQGRLKYLTLGSRYGVFEKGNLFDVLCLSENETTAKRATDLLFHLLLHKDYETTNLYKLTSYLDKERHDQMLDKWFAYYSSLDFSGVDPKELETKGWDAVRKSVPECDGYASFMSSNWIYLLTKHGQKYWEEVASKSIYTQKRSGGSTFEEEQLNLLEILCRNFPFTDKELQQMLFEAIKTKNLLKDQYGERYLQLVSMAYPDRKVPKADFDKLQLGKLLTYSFPLTIKAYKKKAIKAPVLFMPEEKIKDLVADLNSVAVKSNLPEIRLNKLTKFLIAISYPYKVINDYLRVNNFNLGFYREDGETPTDYVHRFEVDFGQVVNAQHCNHFTIGQVTRSISKNEYHYSLFVKCNKSIYKLEYSEEGTHDYTDMQRLVKMLNVCLIDNKEKKRFIGMYSDAFHEFVLMEPAIAMPLSKKYKLGLFAIEEEDGAR
jgi:hypothetical protein